MGYCGFLLALGSIAPSSVSATPLATGIAAAPTYGVARADLFEYLKKQSGVSLTLPIFPKEKLLVWVAQRNAATPSDYKSRYQLLEEHLLIAQYLLESNDHMARREGYWIANECANFAAAKLKGDKWLRARIYEGFLLPKISLANLEVWRDPSRSRVLEAAVSAFGNANERNKQIHVLEWLLSIGGKKPDTNPTPDSLVLETNVLDWARGALAGVLASPTDASHSDLERALALLKAIQSPAMTGYKHLQSQVQARLDQLK